MATDTRNPFDGLVEYWQERVRESNHVLVDWLLAVIAVLMIAALFVYTYKHFNPPIYCYQMRPQC